MIKYSLICRAGHEFEGWFQNSAVFDAQSANDMVVCPSCGSHDVHKALMSPAVATRSNRAEAVQNRPTPGPDTAMHAYVPPAIAEIVRNIRAELETKADYVGSDFAEEARKIHYEESPERGIYGEATSEEVAELDAEGIPVFALPVLPEERN